jgi:ABC-2 type transport system ATP-binding protein
MVHTPNEQFGFERLDAYRVAKEALEVLLRYRGKLRGLPGDLASQLERAAVSTVANICEATGRTGVADRRNRYAIARGEACAAGRSSATRSDSSSTRGGSSSASSRHPFTSSGSSRARGAYPFTRSGYPKGVAGSRAFKELATKRIACSVYLTVVQIEVDKLVKEYRVAERTAGLGAAVRSLFRREYKAMRAVDELSFTIGTGERVGFLGPNGAGKTTTLKVLSGLLHPTSGTVRVGGDDPRRRDPRFLQNITLVMGQKQQLLWDLPPADTFAMNRAIYDLPKREFDETLAELTELLELGALVGRPTRQLSLGERMKCELVAALLHRPKVLFLDEPTIGLDVSMQATLREFIRRYNERHQATVLLTSHYMDDVTALCPRVIVIDKGRLTYDGDLQALVKRVRPNKRVVYRLEGGASETLTVPQAELQSQISALLASRKILDLTVEDPPLEDVMRELFAERA